MSGYSTATGDAQAILGFDSPGPFKIANNYLEASGENVMFGGADPSGIEFSPSDIEIRGSHFFKPASWFLNNKQWSVKNLFELKNAKRVLVERNFFEGNGADSQTGFAIVLKSSNQAGGCPYCETSNVTFRFNRIDNVTGVFNLSAHDATTSVVPMNQILIQDNLITRVADDSDWGGNNRSVFQILHDIDDLEISHNTAILPRQGGLNLAFHEGDKINNLVVVNNIFGHAGFGWLGTGTGSGLGTLNTYADPWSFEGNAIYSGTSSAYPPGNTFRSDRAAVGFLDASNGNYQLATDSPVRGLCLEGADPGAAVAALEQLLDDVR